MGTLGFVARLDMGSGPDSYQHNLSHSLEPSVCIPEIKQDHRAGSLLVWPARKVKIFVHFLRPSFKLDVIPDTAFWPSVGVNFGQPHAPLHSRPTN